MSDIKIFGAGGSTFVRTARMACVEKGVAYTQVPVGAGGIAEIKAPEHLKRHPFGRIPAFSDGDVGLFEATAICRYIDEAYDGPPLQPADVVERARMNAWISAIKDYVLPLTNGGYVAQYLFPKGPNGTVDQAAVDETTPKLRAQLEIIDAALDGRDTIAGDGVTIADLLLTPPLHYIGYMPGGMELYNGLDNLGRWWGVVSSRPSFEQTAPAFIEEQRKAS